MLTNAQVKQYKSLHQKKYRKLYSQFLVQGEKIVMESVKSDWKPLIIIASDSWMNKQAFRIPSEINIEVASLKQLQQITSLKTAPDVIAVLPLKSKDEIGLTTNDLVLALDCIQDPGNLGTVVRIADWYGISTILCAEGTVDFLNPKVVQATMGAFLRVNICYCNLESTLCDMKEKDKELEIYGSFMGADSVYQKKLKKKAVLIMGNEGQGISTELEAICTSRISIPNYPENRNEMESLNISVATGILCAEFRRQG